jgi:hypothetical protein
MRSKLGFDIFLKQKEKIQMSYHYTNNKEGEAGKTFVCNMECKRCEAVKKDKGQCRRTTCKYLPYCHTHLELLCGLKVAPSTIGAAGDGLFALRSFKKGDVICIYYGERLTDAQTNDRYGDADDDIGTYTVTGNKMDAPRIVDGACYRSAAGYVNDLSIEHTAKNRKKTDGKYNATIDDRYINIEHGSPAPGFPHLHGNYMCIVAIKDIIVKDAVHPNAPSKVEIFANYGRGYWDSARHVTAKNGTKRRRVSALYDKKTPKLRLYPGHAYPVHQPKQKRYRRVVMGID